MDNKIIFIQVVRPVPGERNDQAGKRLRKHGQIGIAMVA